jgi:thiol-disulfide isomerase/thioredoxin
MRTVRPTSHPSLLSYLLLCALSLTGLDLLFPADTLAQLPIIRFVRDPDPAPAFQLKDLKGKDISLADSQGKVVLLNFWATWCGPCRAEIPSLISLQDRYKERLQIIGIVVDADDDKSVREVAESEGINYPNALATPEIRIAYGGVSALPTVFVISTEGRVVQKHVGLFNPALYETEVRALLGLPVAARIETFPDEGDIFLKHADRATMLPGVDMTKLSPDQRAAALHKFNAEDCTCGCKYTLAQCRIYDPACQTSQQRTAEIVKEVSAPAAKEKNAAAPAEPPAPDSSKP